MPVISGLYYSVYQGEKLDGPPVVLLHGAGGTHLSWPSEVRRLPGFRVFSLDLPGHGKSDQTGGQQTIAAYAHSVIQWMQAVVLHRAVFIGHSMGGAIAQYLAIYEAERVLGQGLIGSGAQLRVIPAVLENAANPTTMHKAVELMTGASFSDQASPRLVELAGQRLTEVRPSVFYGDLLACDSFDVLEQVAVIQQPTLVICGSEDRLTPTRNSQYLATTIPSARLEIIPGAGHMVMLEQPQVVAGLLTSFLELISFYPGVAKEYVSGY